MSLSVTFIITPRGNVIYTAVWKEYYFVQYQKRLVQFIYFFLSLVVVLFKQIASHIMIYISLLRLHSIVDDCTVVFDIKFWKNVREGQNLLWRFKTALIETTKSLVTKQ